MAGGWIGQGDDQSSQEPQEQNAPMESTAPDRPYQGESIEGEPMRALGPDQPYPEGVRGHQDPNAHPIENTNSLLDRTRDAILGARDFLVGKPARSDLQDFQAPSGSEYTDQSQWEKRQDGSQKGTGWLGLMRRPDGGVSSELSAGVEIDGKETDVPLLVPGLSRAQVQQVLSAKPEDAAKVPGVLDTAVTFARQRIAAGKSPFAGPDDSPGGGALPAIAQRTAQQVEHPVDAVVAGAQSAKNAAGELVKGLGGTFNDLGGAVATTLGAIPVVVDKARSMMKGEPTTSSQDWWFRNFVDPSVDNAKYFAADQNADFAGKASNAIGRMIGMIDQMVLMPESKAAGMTGGAAQITRNAIETAVRATAVPAVSGAVNAGRDVYVKTGDAGAAVKAARQAYVSQVLQAMVPLSAQGTLAKRAVTGAVSGATSTAASTVVGEGRTPTAEELATGAAQGALTGAIAGPRPYPDVFPSLNEKPPAPGSGKQENALPTPDKGGGPGPYPGYHWDPEAGEFTADGKQNGKWMPDAATSGKPQAKASEYQQKLLAVNKAAAAAEKRTDVQVQSTDDGHEVQVGGKTVATFGSKSNAEAAVAKARNLVGTAPTVEETPPPKQPETEPKGAIITSNEPEEGSITKTVGNTNSTAGGNDQESGQQVPASVLGQEVKAPAAPTEAQKASGDYGKPTVDFHGAKLAVENLPDSSRSYVDPSTGEHGSRVMKDAYGEMVGTKGADGQPLDVFMGPKPNAKSVYVIDQKNPDGSFDEHKAMAGYGSKNEAGAAYLRNYQKGWKGLGAITEMPVQKFLAWSKGDLSKPLAYKAPEVIVGSSKPESASGPAPKGAIGQPTDKGTTEPSPPKGGQPTLDTEPPPMNGFKPVQMGTDGRIEFTWSGLPYRTNADASVIERNDGSSTKPKWVKTGSLGKVWNEAKRSIAATKAAKTETQSAVSETKPLGTVTPPAAAGSTIGADVPKSPQAGSLPGERQGGTAPAAQSGHAHSEPVAPGLADEGEVAAGERGLPANAEGQAEASGGGARGAEPQPPGGTREAGTHGDRRGPAVDSDFDLTGQDIGAGGPKAKYKANIAAIRTLKAVEAEGRLATPEERAAIARYVGWGSLKGVFDMNSAGWATEFKELKALLSPEEYAAARASLLNAHYTSKTVVGAMYDAVSQLGFKDGRVLEPAVGVGNFFGMMPFQMRGASTLHGVELDPITSRIATILYPSARITQAGFQDFAVPGGYFDLAIGNPPFGDETITDPDRAEYSGFSIHNYFLAKALDKLRPGGLLQMVVSHYFLDAKDSAARDWISKRAELVSAARLPNTAFKGNAGTEVVTDIVVLRKVEPGEKPDRSWATTVERSALEPKSGKQMPYRVNSYIAAHPENVLGTEGLTGSMYSTGEYNVEPSGDLGTQLAGWVKTLPDGIYKPIDRTDDMDKAAYEVPDGVKPGGYFVAKDGQIAQRGSDEAGTKTANPWTAPNAVALERMKGMIGLRDALRSQMRLERSPEASSKVIEKSRQKLKGVYDTFVREHGFLNHFVNRRLFREDSDAPLVMALEFDYDRGIGKDAAAREGVDARPPSVVQADILQRRVMFPPEQNIKVETAKDALLSSLNQKGTVDLPYMEQVYAKSGADIIKELGDAVFVEPNGAIQTADEYLSGDVKTKLAEAERAAQSDPSFARNAAALKKIIPTDRLPSQIHAEIGAAWIPPEVYEGFIGEITGGSAHVAYIAATAQWSISQVSAGQKDLTEGKWGTDDKDAWQILAASMAGKGVKVTTTYRDNDGTTHTVLMEKETALAAEKQAAIKAEWQRWLWSDPERSDSLTGIYNDKMNRIVNRAYDGSHMTFPGMNPTIALLAHQKNGVWRGLQDRQVLYDHVVGAGKTFQMAALAMEMRRLGIARKPLFVVPNHLTVQWRGEFTRLYPGAYILVAEPADFTKDNRERFFSKIATGDFDAVVMGHSSLKRIGLPRETEMGILNEQITELTEAIRAMKEERGDRHIIRDMENIRAKLTEKMKERLASIGDRSKTLEFNELGVDALYVDEMHEFKNLFYNSTMERHAGMGNPAGSQRAFDLFVKSRWLFEMFGKKTPFVTATGTPVSNSLVEMYNMQRYHQYDQLKQMGLHLFDAWARQFGQVESLYEVAPSGTGWRSSTRFAKFTNLPALMSLYREFADSITLPDLIEQERAQGLAFPVPKIKGGRPALVVAERSPQVAAFMGVPRLARDEKGEVAFGFDPSIDHSIEEHDESTGKTYSVFQGMRSDLLPGRYQTRADARAAVVRAALKPTVAVDPDSILGQFDNLRNLMRESEGKINALSITGLANKAGLDYRLIDPDAPDFPGSKINLAVDNIAAIHKRTEKDKGTQLVFCDMSVPLSARAALAGKVRNAYVRADNGDIARVKGTLHAVKNFESFPFILSPAGKGAEGTRVYDAISGAKLGAFPGSKKDAIATISARIRDPEFQSRWRELNTNAGEIPQEDVDAYNDEHDIDPQDANAIDRDDIAGVSGASSFSVYDDIKAKLIKRGIPAHEIGFVHDYGTPTAKAKLFAAVNAGRIRVLLGSTQKMGAGTNVQQLLVALHHIDAPWKPSELEQREGRIIRRGNKLYLRDPSGFEVEIFRYATAQTYDTRRWQILEHKARGIEALRRYDGRTLSIEDVDGEASNAAEMKAAASGDPLILEETQLRNDVKRLEQTQSAHADQVLSLRRKASEETRFATVTGPATQKKMEAMLAAADKNPLPEKGLPAVSVDGEAFKSGADQEAVVKAIAEAVHPVNANLGKTDTRTPFVYRGIQFKLHHIPTWKLAYLESEVAQIGSWSLERELVSPSGLLTRFKNYLDGLPAQVENLKDRIAASAESGARLAEQSKEPFKDATALTAVRHDYQRIQALLLAKGPPIPEAEKPILEAALTEQKAKLRAAGYGPDMEELGVRSSRMAYSRDAGLREPTDAYNGLTVTLESAGGQTETVKAGFATRPGTTSTQVDAGRAFLGSLIALRDRRAGARVLADGLTNGFVDKGHVSLVGQSAKSPAELATLAQVYRDPRVEHMHVFFMQGDRIVDQARYGERLPGSVSFPSSKALHNQMYEQMRAAGADGYYLLHNHPDGISSPSDEDVQLTVGIGNNVRGLKSHIVIDHDEYAQISPTGQTRVTQAPQFHGYNPRADARVPHVALNKLITAESQLAQLARMDEIQAAIGNRGDVALLVATDAHARVTSIGEYPISALSTPLKAAARIRRQRAASGSGGRVFALAKDPERLRHLFAVGLLDDLMDSDGRRSYLYAGEPSNVSLGNDLLEHGHLSYGVGEPQHDYNQIFFSALTRAADTAKRDKGTAQEWMGTLKNLPGVKQEELDWSGLAGWLENRGRVSKADVVAYLKANEIDVGEVMRGDATYPARYAVHKLPGGENYRELMLTLPPTHTADDYHSSHWPEPNVLAHVRFDERTDAEGKRDLHIAEIQSDWHQAGRKRGYANQNRAQVEAARFNVLKLQEAARPVMRRNGNMGFDHPYEALTAALRHDDWQERWHISTEDAAPLQAWKDARDKLDAMEARDRQGVPNAPFKTTWPELALKRMIRYAAENGFERLSWDTGATIADRFGVQEKLAVVKLHVGRLADGTYSIGADSENGPIDLPNMQAAELAPMLGERVAERIINDPDDQQEHDFDDYIKTGAKGMSGFYDRMLPAKANALVKKWGVQVERGTVPTDSVDEAGTELPYDGEAPAHYIDITPAMRESVMGGQAVMAPKAPYGDDRANDRRYRPNPQHTDPLTYAEPVDLSKLQMSSLSGLMTDNGITSFFTKRLAPANMDAQSKEAAQITRAYLGDLAQTTFEVQLKLDAFSKQFDLLAHQDRLDFMDAMETGSPQPIPALQPAANLIRKLFDTWRQHVQALGTGALQNWILNYFPHIWQDPAKAKNAFATTFGRRPLQGSKAFLKQRTIPTIKDGIALGLVPVSTNPLILTLLKLREMQRYVSAVKLMEALKTAKLAVLSHGLSPIPPDFTEINDAVGKVWHFNQTTHLFEIIGRYSMPENAARIINNHLSASSLQGELPMEILRRATSFMSSMQLGFSAFHLGFTTLDAMVSKNALGIERLVAGDVTGAVKAFTEGFTPIGAALNIRRGHQLLKAYSDPAGATPLLRQLVAGLTAAGGRAKMDTYFLAARGISPFTGVGVASLAKDIHAALTQPSHQLSSAAKAVGVWALHDYPLRLYRDLQAMAKEMPAWQMAFEIAGRGVRASTAIIMEHIVPLQKLGVFSDLASDFFRTHPLASPEETTGAMQRIWDSVDNRLGEMVYDNLFWDRTHKDLMHMAVRAVGWNIGTIREIGGAPIDALRLLEKIHQPATIGGGRGGRPNDPFLRRFADEMGHRIPYVMSLLITIGILGAILGYLMGRPPKEKKDYYFPQTSGTTKYGTPERMSLPSYMKDLVEYKASPVQTLLHKANPLFGFLYDCFENEDFYGDAIYDPDASWLKQVGQEAKYFFRESTPFSIQGSTRFNAESHVGGGWVMRAAPFVGFNPAPASITSPDATNAYQNRRDEEKYLKGLYRQRDAARDAGDHDKANDLSRQIAERKRRIRQDTSEAKRERAKGKALSDKIGAVIAGKDKTSQVAAIHAAGYPALAELWRAMPEQARPRIAEAMSAYA